MIKNVVFDMGNVLIQWNPDYIVSRLLDNSKFAQAIKKAVFENELWGKLDEGTVTEEEVFENAKSQLPEEAYDDLEEVMDNWQYCMPVVIETNELAKTLRQKGYNVYLLSNANKRFHGYGRENVPSLKFMNGYMISADEKCVKPSKEIYEKFFKKFDLNPDECVFIDDLNANCEGARNAGMRAYCFDGDYDKLVEYLKSVGVEA